jgi:hypothetical protein
MLVKPHAMLYTSAADLGYSILRWCWLPGIWRVIADPANPRRDGSPAKLSVRWLPMPAVLAAVRSAISCQSPRTEVGQESASLLLCGRSQQADLQIHGAYFGIVISLFKSCTTDLLKFDITSNFDILCRRRTIAPLHRAPWQPRPWKLHQSFEHRLKFILTLGCTKIKDFALKKFQKFPKLICIILLKDFTHFAWQFSWKRRAPKFFLHRGLFFDRTLGKQRTICSRNLLGMGPRHQLRQWSFLTLLAFQKKGQTYAFGEVSSLFYFPPKRLSDEIYSRYFWFKTT